MERMTQLTAIASAIVTALLPEEVSCRWAGTVGVDEVEEVGDKGESVGVMTLTTVVEITGRVVGSILVTGGAAVGWTGGSTDDTEGTGG